MQTSETIDQLAAALATAQGEMVHAEKDSKNPHFKSSYASLAAVREAVRPIHKQGLSVVQTVRAEGSAVTVETLLAHKSGQWVRDALTLTARDAGPQSIGSCITYGRRYALASIVGIAADDDDAEAATGPRTNYSHEVRPSERLQERPWGSVGELAPPTVGGPLYVLKVESRPTKNKNVTRYEVIFSDGVMASTIKNAVAALAERAINERIAVAIETKSTQFGTELVELRLDEPHDAEPVIQLQASDIPF